MNADEIKLPDKEPPQFQPVLVFMKMGGPIVCGYGGGFQLPDTQPQTLHFVGCIGDKDFAIDESGGEANYNALREKLAAFDVELNIYVQPAMRGDGQIGTAVSYGVVARDYDHAKTLPGFAPLIMWSGYYPPISGELKDAMVGGGSGN